MTVFEPATFLAVFRAVHPISADVVAETLGGWFECLIARDVERAASDMVGRGWLVVASDGLMATAKGRRVARMPANGLIRMLDQGTRLIDVALMMAVLRLTKGELDDGDD